MLLVFPQSNEEFIFSTGLKSTSLEELCPGPLWREAARDGGGARMPQILSRSRREGVDATPLSPAS